MVWKPKMKYTRVEQLKSIQLVGFRITMTKPTSSVLSPERAHSKVSLVKLMSNKSENHNTIRILLSHLGRGCFNIITTKPIAAGLATVRKCRDE